LNKLPKKVRHSKLHFLQDKAGKTRNVAIGDYWSQMALLPLHDSLMKMLKSIKSDCT